MLEQPANSDDENLTTSLADKIASYFTNKIDIEELIRFADGLQLDISVPDEPSAGSTAFNTSSSSSTTSGWSGTGSCWSGTGSSSGTISSSCSTIVSDETFELVLQVDDYVRLVDSVRPVYGEQERTMALYALSTCSQLSDIAAADSCGSQLLKNLTENLIIIDNDDDNDYFRLVLRLYKRLLFRCPWNVVEMVFVSLIEYLYIDFNNNNSTSSSSSYSRLFEIYHLILTTLSLISSNTARIAQSIIERIVGSFIDLLATTTTTASTCGDNNSIIIINMTPFEIICYLDVRASWISTLCHNVRTRNVLAIAFRRNIDLIENLTRSVKYWLRNPRVPRSIDTMILLPDSSSNNSILPIVIKYTKFLSSLKILETLSRFRVLYNSSDTIGNVSIIESISDDISWFLTNKQHNTNNRLPRTTVRLMVDCQAVLWKVLPEEAIIKRLLILFNDTLSLNMFKFLQRYLQDEIQMNALIDYDTSRLKSAFDISITNNSNSNNNNNNNNNNNSRTTYESLSRRNKWSKIIGTNRPNNESVDCVTNAWFNMVRCKVHIGNGGNLFYILNICKYFLRQHFVYLVLASRFYSFKNFIDRLIDTYAQAKQKNSKNSIVTCFEELFIVIASSAFGFNVLYKSAAFKDMVVSKIQLKSVIWNSSEWKSIATLLLAESEYGAIFRKYYGDTFGQFMQNLHKLSNNGIDCEQVDSFIEQTLSIAYAVSCSFEGVKALFYGYCTGETCDISVSPNLTTALDLIHLFEIGLSPSYEYKYHYTILQLLDILTTEFSAILFLNYHLHYQEKLLYLQKGSIHEETGEVIIDECSILRSSLLTRSYCPGVYYDDRRLIGSCLYECKESSISFVLQQQQKTTSELQKFLHTTKHIIHDIDWLQRAREIYRLSMVKDDVKVSTMIELIEKTAKAMLKSTHIRKLSISEESKSQKLFPEDYAGISIAVQYGLKRGMLSQSLNNEGNLAEMIKAVKTYTGKINSKSYTGFDCFLATLFIMAAGNGDRLLQTASYIIILPAAAYLWPRATSIYKKRRLIFCHILNWILQQEIPTIFHIMQANGMHWWSICQLELCNCFWYSMDWINICHLVCFAILHNSDYLLYFFVSVARTNERKIMTASNEGTLIRTTKRIFHGCRFSDHIVYMDDLNNRYHKFVTSLLLEHVI